MKAIRCEKHNKGNKNKNNYEITNLSKICHEIENHKYAANPKYQFLKQI